MPSLIADNVLQIQMIYRVGGESVENVYHVHKNVDWTVPEIEQMVAAFAAWEAVTASPIRSNQVDLYRITATDLTSLTSGRVDDSLAAPVIGGDPSPVLPGNVTFAVKASIGERGKGRNGRTFWIGLAESQVSGDIIFTVTADAIQDALNDLRDAVPVAVSGAQLGIIHTRVNGAPISPATFSPIVAWSYTDLLVDSQRDRLAGHKRHKRPSTP